MAHPEAASPSRKLRDEAGIQYISREATSLLRKFGGEAGIRYISREAASPLVV